MLIFIRNVKLNSEGLNLPKFMDNMNFYIEAIEEIADVNFIHAASK